MAILMTLLSASKLLPLSEPSKKNKTVLESVQDQIFMSSSWDMKATLESSLNVLLRLDLCQKRKFMNQFFSMISKRESNSCMMVKLSLFSFSKQNLACKFEING